MIVNNCDKGKKNWGWVDDNGHTHTDTPITIFVSKL